MNGRERTGLFGLVVVGLLASGLAPRDRFTWFLEVLPVLLAVPILLLTTRTFPLTPLAYRLLALHAVVLLVGGHYTYAEVPLGYWLQDLFGFARNHFDRIGHFMQGFVPAIVVREILLRRSPLQPGPWTFWLVTSVCLAFSACYELFEWAMALATGEAADAFLGTQGDQWDTQWDLFLALVGALSTQWLLGRRHDRALRALAADDKQEPPILPLRRQATGA